MQCTNPLGLHHMLLLVYSRSYGCWDGDGLMPTTNSISYPKLVITEREKGGRRQRLSSFSTSSAKPNTISAALNCILIQLCTIEASPTVQGR